MSTYDQIREEGKKQNSIIISLLDNKQYSKNRWRREKKGKSLYPVSKIQKCFSFTSSYFIFLGIFHYKRKIICLRFIFSGYVLDMQTLKWGRRNRTSKMNSTHTWDFAQGFQGQSLWRLVLTRLLILFTGIQTPSTNKCKDKECGASLLT